MSTAEADNDVTHMHHKIRVGLKKRLKHLSADISVPVTDIVNMAIEEHLEKLEASGAIIVRPRKTPPTAERLRIIKAANADGAFYESVSRFSKAELVDVARLLEMPADLRMSGDKVVNMIRGCI